MKYIKIRGARQHNLKNVNLDIPRDNLVIVTGVSGSGKSSLAFDTIYAEGHRRYVESLSTYARQFIGQMDKPEVESIEGLSPAIAIEQRTASRNPRSTVGTVTEIYDYLRLLFARVGIPHCYNCGKRIDAQTVDMMAERVQSLPEGTKINIMSPVVRGKKGEFQKELKRLRKDGFARVRVDGSTRDLDEDIAPDKNKRHDIDVVIDRLIIRTGIGKRLRDSLEIAIGLSGGLVGIQVVDGEELLFSENYACPECGISMPELAPRMFSFNSPYGACPECGGLGTKIYFDENLIVPDPGLSIREGAIAPWERKDSIYFHQMLEALSSHYGFDINTPFNKLSERVRHVLLHGSGDEKIGFYFDRRGRRYFYEKHFKGVLNKLEQHYREEKSGDSKMELSRYMNISDCPVCGGARLKKESLSVTVGEKNIDEICRMSIHECTHFFDNLSFSRNEAIISERIRKEIRERLQFLIDVGMDYLSLSRSSGTLSGGEAQRIRLATQIGSGLVGVLYVLDEPTIGLHPRDSMRLVTTLKRLRDMGNTVLVVEHDAQIMNCSDDIIDVGPGAGLNGGKIVFHGTPEEIRRSEVSLTGKYLSGRLSIPVPESRRPLSGRFIIIEGASENNLRDIDIKIPANVFTCVTGVSGSGKSTMVIETLYKALRRRLNRYRGKSGRIKQIRDFGGIERVITMDQQPIGRTPRSNPATYTGVLTHVRDLFSQLPESR
ncbi:MAG: excinuclease ABC subunit UvrA, partial [Deltaproteobacteria bacterium]|nr:excinuclease ABC subunit UvrA [Deltaproteobacteria bacterium]